MKKSFFPFQILMLLLVSLIISVSTASAITITQTQAFSGKPDFNSILTFNQWSNPGYTLQSIEIIMSLNIAGGTLQGDNDSDLAGNVTYTLGASGSLDFPGPFTWADAVTATSSTTIYHQANDGDGAGGYDSGGNDWGSYNGGPAPGQPIVNNTFINAGDFLSYTGTGTVDLTAKLSQVSNVSGLPSLSSATSPVDASGLVTIKYTDDAPPAVPEPATLLLLGSGIVGLIGAGRRGRQKV